MKKIIFALMLAPIFVGAVTQAKGATPAKAAWQLAGVPDFKSMTDVREKKGTFFRYLLPRVTAENTRIMKDREQLLSLQRKSALTADDKAWLAKISKTYRMEEFDGDKSSKGQWFTEILTRVDVIPPSLAMAQASYESGWGTSRFARDGNNWFGMMCYTKGCGFVPKGRNTGGTRELAKYKTVDESVNAYILTLNSHPTYKSLRDIRAKIRAAGKTISGSELAQGLLKYSTRGQAYIDEVQGMIRINKLAQFDAEPTTAKISG